MLRGKVRTESRACDIPFVTPTTYFKGCEDYLIEGQKILIELEVVPESAIVRKEAAFIELNNFGNDENLSGVFRLSKFTLGGKPASGLSPKADFIESNSKELYQWLDSNIKLDEDYDKATFYELFSRDYPKLAGRHPRTSFYGLVKKYCQIKSFEYKDFQVKKKPWFSVQMPVL